MTLAGRCALVTGSTRGIGLATARRLAAEGCRVALHGVEPAADVAEMQTAIEREYAVGVTYHRVDLRDRGAVEALVAAAGGAMGRIDILINNAVVRHESPVEAFDPAAWDEALAVNLSAAFHAIRLTLSEMKARGWGRIVNVSSIYGLRAAVNRVGYVATKSALIGLTRAVALETAASGVTCNAVCPGTVETPVHVDRLRALMSAEGLTRDAAERRLLAGKQPTGRFIDPGQVAAMIAFLCGPSADDVTGAVLPIDGGWSSS